MKIRLVLALLVVFGLTAFAPAPFPRSERRDSTAKISLRTLQGRWRAIKWENSRPDGKHEPDPKPPINVFVRIAQDRWTFMDGDQEGNTLVISVEPAKSAAHLNFYSRPDKQTSYGTGLLRRQGTALQLAFRWHAKERPTSFDRLPDGFWIVTLERS